MVSAIPSVGLNMHLHSEECHVAIRWWLGLNTSTASSCPFCPGAVLDPLGHHATSCRHGGDVVTRHNHRRDTFAEFCHRAHLPVRVEVGYGLSGDHINTCPADALVRVETFGHWRKEAQNIFSHLASLLSMHQCRPKSVTLFDIYSRMNIYISVSRANIRVLYGICT